MGQIRGVDGDDAALTDRTAQLDPVLLGHLAKGQDVERCESRVVLLQFRHPCGCPRRCPPRHLARLAAPRLRKRRHRQGQGPSHTRHTDFSLRVLSLIFPPLVREPCLPRQRCSTSTTPPCCHILPLISPLTRIQHVTRVWLEGRIAPVLQKQAHRVMSPPMQRGSEAPTATEDSPPPAGARPVPLVVPSFVTLSPRPRRFSCARTTLS